VETNLNISKYHRFVEGEEVVVATTVMGEVEKAKEAVMVEVEMEVVVVVEEGVMMMVMGEGVKEEVVAVMGEVVKEVVVAVNEEVVVVTGEVVREKEEGVKEVVVVVKEEGVKEEVVVVMGEVVKEEVVGEMGEVAKEVVEAVEVVVMVEGEKEMKKLKVVLQVDKHHPYKNNSHYMDLHNIHNCWGHLKGLYKFHCNMLALNWGIIFCHMEFVIRFLIEDL
jgi:hypothetical protein